jgi:ribosomal protein S8
VEEVAPIISNMLQKAKNSKALKHYAADVNNSSAIINVCDLIERLIKGSEPFNALIIEN